ETIERAQTSEPGSDGGDGASSAGSGPQKNETRRRPRSGPAAGPRRNRARRTAVVRPWKLAETNYAYVKEHSFEVAVLPLGATEPHNLHLPYGTDVFEGETVG